MMNAVVFRWSGQVMESVDGLAFIGRNPGDTDNIYIATGDSGMGMTHGTIAGLLITDLIMKRESPWSSLYDPSRRPVHAAGEFIRESLNVAAQYTDWVTGGDVETEAQIPRGQGAVLRDGLTKMAIYRDARGDLHTCSARVPASGLHRGLEPCRKYVGLSLSRLKVRQIRKSSQWSCDERPHPAQAGRHLGQRSGRESVSHRQIISRTFDILMAWMGAGQAWNVPRTLPSFTMGRRRLGCCSCQTDESFVGRGEETECVT
jgi:hypothetical protein